jgi:uncharacterized membrane protein (UPF0182 family)
MSQDDYDIPEVFRRAMEEAGWQTEEGGEGGGPVRPRRTLPPPRRSPRVGRWAVILAIALLALFSVSSIATFYTDWLWFDHLGFRGVFTTQLVTRVALFSVAFLVAAAVLLGNWLLARRNALREASPLGPQYLASGGVRAIILIAGLLLAFLFASAAAGQWEEVLRFLYRVPFDTAEPIFNKDAGFYVFELPIFEFIQGWLLSLLFVALIGLVPIYSANNLADIQRGAWRPFSSGAFRRHLFIMAAVLIIIWALGYWLDIYRLLFSTRGVVFGASYTDLRAVLWGLRVEIILALLTAGALLFSVFRPSPRLIAGAAGLWIAATFLFGGIIPGIIQRYSVEPNELTLEEPYIEHNIEFTRRAFKLDEIEVRDFGEVRSLSAEDVLDNEAMLRNIRLWDYRPLQQTYQQLQALRPYYTFGEVDIDRYDIDGEERQVMLAVREMDKARLPAPSWVNQHLEFTHGFGIVMNPVDEFTPEGQPSFFIQDIPPRSTVDLEVTQPEIYFGEYTNDEVYVGGGRAEFSYPAGDQNVYTTYSGTGGIELSSFFRRLAFAIRQSDANVLLTDDINDEARVLINRQIQQRIRTITPFLTLDRDPYIVVVDGRLVWIQDAYTTTRNYPYSTPITIQVQPTGQLPTGEIPVPGPTRTFNYMRNAVKITLDAYDGNVNYYIADPDDPIIRAYDAAFPGLFRPYDELPEGLRRHTRYPVDMFHVQSRQYLTYHMTDPRAFYNQEDLWEVPTEFVDDVETQMEPYYVTLPLPGEQTPEYLLILPFNPSSKNNMVAWMAARNDGSEIGELVVYRLPRQELVFGPIQVEGRIDQDPVISQQFSLWDQRGSSVIRGNLLVLPINQSFLYIEPVYLLSDTSALPELRRIIVATDTGIAMEPTLEQALISLGRGVVSQQPLDTGAEIPEDTATPILPTDATVEDLIAAADAHFEAAEAAQQAGDWATYGEELEALRQTLDRLVVLIGSTP